MPVATARTPGERSFISPDILGNAGKDIDDHLSSDRRYPEIADQIGVFSHASIGLSGLNTFDYPSLSSVSDGLSSVHLISSVKHVPLPSELVEQFSYTDMQCNCQMGLFPEIRRAWLSIDSDIFVWNYEDGSDLAYFDGLSETILSAGLVKPKPGIFQEHIKFLLCLTTPVDVVLLGVSFSDQTAAVVGEEEFVEMHLLPEPLFSLQTDNVYMSGVTGTLNGRIFLCGRDGCVYEMDYQGAGSWFGKKCKKINHSASSLSFLVPSFLSFSFTGEDPVIQLAVDNTRNILYCRTEKGSIQVFDLGKDGFKTKYVASAYQDGIANKAASILRLLYYDEKSSYNSVTLRERQRDQKSVKSVDRSQLKPIVHIAPIPTNESQFIHLVAITQSGVRLYFTTTTVDRFEDRPSKLSVVHVRMPPGSAPSARLEKPSHVHAAYYRQGIALLCSSPSDDNNFLWCVSPDIFPFQKTLQESSVTTRLDGRAWAIHEVPESAFPNLPSPVPNKWPDPPAIVTQHALPPRKFVVLSAQGSYLFTTIRPFEQLKQLLIRNNGPDSEAVHAFFKLLQEDHACASALVLACSSTDLEIADWATQAFFKYGSAPLRHPTLLTEQSRGERVDQYARRTHPGGGVSSDTTIIPPTPIVGGSHSGSYLATPAVRMDQSSPARQLPMQSTPFPGAPTTGGAIQTDMSRSGTFSGLCFYISRILGPVWNERLVAEDYHVLPEPPNNLIYSRLTSVQLGWFVEQLQNLEKWLEKNKNLFAGYTHGQQTPRRTEKTLLSAQQSISLGGVNIESNNVVAIIHLIKRCHELLSLWQILDDNQFHLVVDRLSPATRDRLKILKFREIVVSGNEVCNHLIASLMTCFLDDNTTTDIISNQLRDLCPTLYTTDDAVCTKANELLDTAKKSTDKYERKRTLQEATRLYREVANQIDLVYICSQFQELRFYEGIVELSVHMASIRDPQNLALDYYESGEPSHMGQGHDAFLARKYCYNCVLESLTHLLITKQSRDSSTMVPNRPGPPQTDINALTSDEAEQLLEMTLVTALRSRDELFLSSIFDWLIEKNLTERLLEVRSEFLETYLKRTAAMQRPNNIPSLDLLWKYYEKTQNYSAASRTLSKLAEREGNDLDLEGRLEYLSRAIMSAKSCNVRPSSISDGEFLHELEEKLEVARLQLQVYEQLLQLKDAGRHADINEALDQLNSKLMDVTKLYGDFADRYRLPECMLAIIHCAGHFDPILVDDLWKSIVDAELYRTRQDSQNDRMTALRYKLVVLGKTYVHSERYFPLKYLIRILEESCCRLGWDATWVFETMLEIGVFLSVLHIIYDRLFKTKDQVWQNLNRPFYILEVLYNLILKFVESPTLVPPQDRPTFTATVYDACATYLVELQSIGSRHAACEELIGMFKSLQSRLKRAL